MPSRGLPGRVHRRPADGGHGKRGRPWPRVRRGTTMTEQKHLKQLVRERMARTGESYTTARRHVVGRRGTPGATLTAPPARHRLTALLARMMRDGGYVAPHTGEPYSQAMLCG